LSFVAKALLFGTVVVYPFVHNDGKLNQLLSGSEVIRLNLGPQAPKFIDRFWAISFCLIDRYCSSVRPSGIYGLIGGLFR
jgi:hypothetical protein